MRRFWRLVCSVLLTAVLLSPCLSGGRALASEASSASDGAAALGGMTAPDGTIILNGTAASEETSASEELNQDDGWEQWLEEARKSLQDLLQDHAVMALVYLNDAYAVKAEPSEESGTVVTVSSGQQVLIQDAVVNEAGEVWEKVLLNVEDVQYEGYVSRMNLACSDEKFLEWEATYGMNPAAYLPMPIAEDGDPVYPDIEQFPDSYRAALTALKKSHPSWIFVKMNTGLFWDDVVANEVIKDRNWIPASYPECMREELRSPGWCRITEEALEYYLDPRNWLTEEGIFQFEQLTYNESYHTEEAVQTFLNNTFMSGIIPGLELTYAKTFWAVGKELGVSPFHLACRVYQEQGKGQSPLISGTYPGYEGFYNYFNIGASGTTNEEVITKGLQYAKDKGWTNGYLSIQGGASVISKNYILAGQDTLYLQKFDVDKTGGLYGHQYMQNVCAPSSEGKNIRKLYEGAGSLENTFVFKIPFYEGMPETACEKPTVSYTVSLPVPEGYQYTTAPEMSIYLDGVAYPAVSRNGKLYAKAADGSARTATLYQYNEAGVPIGMSVWELSHNGAVYQPVELTGLKDLLIGHGASIRITGRSGIRFVSSVSKELRKQLLETGVDGYTLKEYGTLAMIKSVMSQFPLVKNGKGVFGGMAYGVNAEGKYIDQVFQEVENRYQYTSVLVGLPPEEYKTQFAFRGYVILNKNGQDVVFYGPILDRNIYDLAVYFVNSGYYPEGSSADQFLRKLISDADAVQTVQANENITDTNTQ